MRLLIVNFLTQIYDDGFIFNNYYKKNQNTQHIGMLYPSLFNPDEVEGSGEVKRNNFHKLMKAFIKNILEHVAATHKKFEKARQRLLGKVET